MKNPISFGYGILVVCFILLSVSCSKNDDSSELSPMSQYSYEAVFLQTLEGNYKKFDYSGGSGRSDKTGTFKENIGDHGALSVDLNHDGFKINGVFIMTADGYPLMLDHEKFPDLQASLLEFHDTENQRVFKANFGMVSISSLTVENTAKSEKNANFRFEFSGHFDMYVGNNPVPEQIMGTGVVAIGVPEK